jgi:hypothetical protein
VANAPLHQLVSEAVCPSVELHRGTGQKSEARGKQLNVGCNSSVKKAGPVRGGTASVQAGSRPLLLPRSKASMRVPVSLTSLYVIGCPSNSSATRSGCAAATSSNPCTVSGADRYSGCMVPGTKLASSFASSGVARSTSAAGV